MGSFYLGNQIHSYTIGLQLGNLYGVGKPSSSPPEEKREQDENASRSLRRDFANDARLCVFKTEQQIAFAQWQRNGDAPGDRASFGGVCFG